ncbi:MAG: NAD(P)(+) transhydrogenase (Re/Si-specific) subunit beta [Bacteroidia bacterium]|nr:NAD(P)(+) transhydrogenase (Re/Si-specific) subunit beta [Bacteroidia bacterium]
MNLFKIETTDFSFNLLQVIYLVGSVSFMVGLKMLSKPESARKGNLIAAFGMIIAIFGTIFLYGNDSGDEGVEIDKTINYLCIVGGIIVGTIIGAMMAKKVKMTGMPQMVSFFNGMGGACAMIISLVEFDKLLERINSPGGNFKIMFEGFESDMTDLGIIFLGLIIGGISFAGSMVAFGKLEEKLKDITLPGQQFINIGLLISILTISGFATAGYIENPNVVFLVLALSLLYGVLFVFPIGGADMPVVISLLNSFTGVAAAMGGFLYGNKVMLIGGILVGSAGTLLTVVMCKAMNRSLLNVLIGNFGGGSKGESKEITGSIKEITKSDAAVLMKYSKKVVIVPGYGLAVAQAQHVCHELEQILEDEGVEVKYAIHPVAGRMPGHMNVLLAESNVSYDKLIEMDEINPEFKTTDVVLIVGANDVVNPAAKNDPASPIFGMPILDVEDAAHTIVMKRSMKAGYAGIENELFYKPKNSMLFGDAKKTLADLVSELKSLG